MATTTIIWRSGRPFLLLSLPASSWSLPASSRSLHYQKFEILRLFTVSSLMYFHAPGIHPLAAPVNWRHGSLDLQLRSYRTAAGDLLLGKKDFSSYRTTTPASAGLGAVLQCRPLVSTPGIQSRSYHSRRMSYWSSKSESIKEAMMKSLHALWNEMKPALKRISALYKQYKGAGALIIGAAGSFYVLISALLSLLQAYAEGIPENMRKEVGNESAVIEELRLEIEANKVQLRKELLELSHVTLTDLHRVTVSVEVQKAGLRQDLKYTEKMLQDKMMELHKQIKTLEQKMMELGEQIKTLEQKMEQPQTAKTKGVFW